ncbi:MAG: hypothetical protein QME85_02260 [Candidatus Saccharicenans sp.]|nr:hypothetical protein [Candidatus Saccharicenans sp.]MDI6849352.1 hypothetical protein [Candidatus Saccharicenans sp.]
MNRVILLDFEDKDKQFLEQEQVDTFLIHTSDFRNLPTILPEARVIFYQLNWPVEEEAVPSGLADKVQEMVADGSRVVCFVGKGHLYQLTGVIGTFPDIHFQESVPGEVLLVTPEMPFNLVFEKFSGSLAHLYKLLPNSFGTDLWEVPASSSESWKIVAKSHDGFPVSLLIRKGKGFIWLLPWFGQNNIRVADFILKDVFPLMEMKGKEVEPMDWIDREEYLFPEIKELFLKKEEEKKRFEERLKELDQQIKTLRETQQEAFNRLLKAEGQELKAAVLQAFKYLGWARVVDVDQYWKNVIRDKEEDLWLIENNDQPVEVCLRKEFLILVVIRSSRNWATDDDCILLQRYKGRRMQEFDNTRMKSILVGNYFNLVEAKLRNNPYSQFQVEEAEKDGNALLTTYELFLAIKAEKEGLISKEEIRKQVREKAGLIKINY